VLKSHKEARRFCSECNEAQHFTWKELKAVTLTNRTFLLVLEGKIVFLHKDNQAV
jgi:hypothetical protein